ncbi:MAG: hypothetical protein RLZZ528_49 [Pseudomonadota bacterium]|jgi:hypothetical protein
MARSLVLLAVLGLAGCGDFPDLGPGDPAAAQGPYPALLTHDALQAVSGAADEATDPAASLQARGKALKARADCLRKGALPCPPAP